VETVGAESAVLTGDDGERLSLPAEWLPGVGPGDDVVLAVRLTRRRAARHDGEAPPIRHAPLLDTLSLLALVFGVAALVYHLFVR
jgi:hypothetical protein